MLQDIGDSLSRARDRYTYTVSVSNMYHSIDREGFQLSKKKQGVNEHKRRAKLCGLGELQKQTVLLLIQGGEPYRPSLERHRSLGKIGAQTITI